MARFANLAASVVISFGLGGIYAWSAFVPGLQTDHGLTAAKAQLVFGLAILVFTLVTIPAGRLCNAWGPRRLVSAGVCLLACGYWIAAAGNASFPALLLGIGILGGTGIGLAYICPISVNVRWFPEHKGLITGVTVFGFGAGGIGLSSSVAWLFSHGLGIPGMFIWIGAAYAAILIPAACVLGFPPQRSAAVGDTETLPLRDVLRLPGFGTLALGIFAGTFSGLLVVGNIKSIGLDSGFSPQVATAAIGLFALGNAVGRIVWGRFADIFGGRCAPASLIVLSGSIVLLGIPSLGSSGFLASAAACGFGFGACFVIYAAEVTQRYGVERFGAVYPLVFLFYGVSGIAGPVSGGWLFDKTGSYRPAILLAAAISLLAAAGFSALDRAVKTSRVPTRFQAPAGRLRFEK